MVIFKANGGKFVRHEITYFINCLDKSYILLYIDIEQKRHQSFRIIPINSPATDTVDKRRSMSHGGINPKLVIQRSSAMCDLMAFVATIYGLRSPKQKHFGTGGSCVNVNLMEPGPHAMNKIFMWLALNLLKSYTFISPTLNAFIPPALNTTSFAIFVMLDGCMIRF